MPVPSPRNSIRIARGNFSDLNTNKTAFGEGEFIYAIDQDRFYTYDSGLLAPVGVGTVELAGIDKLTDVDTTTVTPGVGQVLKWDGSNWAPADDSNTDAVTSVNTQTGDVVLGASDVGAATAAQGALADSAVQPGDNVSDLNNDAGYITLAEVPADVVTSVAGKTGDVTLVKADVGLGDVDNTSDANKPISTATQTALDAKADLVGGLIPTSQIPAIAITEFLGSVGSEAAMLALTGQLGDWCLRTDKAVGYVIVGADTSVIAGWEAFTVPGSAVTSINTQVGDVVLGASDVGAATTAQGALADSAVQPGDNVSDLNNDAGYITLAEVPADVVTSVAGRTGDVVLVKADVGLGNVDNTSDANKPISTATQTALDGKATTAQGALADSAVQPTDSIGVLSDVDITTVAPTDGQALIWDNAGGNFVPGEAGLVDSVNGQTGDVVLDTDNISEGSTNLYSQWDAATGGINYANGNVGIGTSAPNTLLHVKAASNLTTDLPFTVQNSADILRLGIGAYGLSNTVGTSQGSDFYYNVGREHLFQTDGDTKVVIKEGGSVGIGTTSPAAQLHIRATGAALYVDDPGSINPLRLTQTGVNAEVVNRAAGEIEFGLANDGNIKFVNGSSKNERARIDISGRLLVGTSSAPPAVESIVPQLVSSSAGGSTAAQDVAIYNYKNAGGSGRQRVGPKLLLGNSRSGTNGSLGGIVVSGDQVGNIRFAGDDGSAFITAAEITAEVDGTPGTDDMPGRLKFSVTADGSASPSEAMRINNAGELLVGYTSDNGAYKLQVNSQIFATSATIATSDGRYKENVATLDGCVDLVKALRPVSFDWKAQEPVTRVDEDGETVVVREAHNFPDGKQVGFIAQEVEEVLADKPWLGSVIKQNVRPAVTDADGIELAPEEEFLGIAEGNLVAVLTSALKDAIGRIESLEAEVAALKA